MSEYVSEVSDSSFEQDVLNSDKPVLVDFWAAWCAPCRMLAPTVEAVAAAYQQRNLPPIVNAITVPTTQGSDGFTLLRDLAWSDLPYVCVKDDLGNRWFSTLIVPSGTMQRSPQLFIASIVVTESTDVPYPVSAQA